MIISNEHYNRLKQNDRIEYLLLENDLLKNFPKLPTLKYIASILATMIVLPLLWLAAFGSGSLITPQGLIMGKVLGICLRVYIILWILEFILFIYALFKFKKQKKELIERFFKLESKK